MPFYRYGVIHGDPHLGNYTVRPDLDIILLDFGCVRIFQPRFVKGVIDRLALQRVRRCAGGGHLRQVVEARTVIERATQPVFHRGAHLRRDQKDPRP